ncbi:MAG: UDP-N-acetylglucosamine--N-acetylmuramyl-(pentapeptide) pyrophosphoryl-undecaprenol N-acetylglucosamine transferase [Patescibacteria group bacterium]
MKILFSGGGTLGPVTPLLAIKEVIENNPDFLNTEFVWLGTKTGPEKYFLKSYNLKFKEIISGKFRRYFSFANIIDIFKIFTAFFQAFFILLKEKPDVCISAGGFVSVPVHIAAWFLGIPTWIHQQDYKVGLANNIMKVFASIITTSLEEHLMFFSKQKTFWLGNPVREEIFLGNKEEAKKIFNLKTNLPIIFVTGGGTGSLRINQMIIEALPHLQNQVQIIHLSGENREKNNLKEAEKLFNFYHTYSFFSFEMKHAFAAADLIISRGGFGTLTEISALKKTAIIIPKTGHQLDNVKFLAKEKAVVFLDERFSDGLILAGKIKELLQNESERIEMSKKLNKKLPVAKKEKIIEIFKKILK